MKNKITQEIRDRIAALYWDQPIMSDDEMESWGIEPTVPEVRLQTLTDFWLLVTPISAITDEDAIEVARILDWFGVDTDGNEVGDIEDFKLHFKNQAWKWDHYGIEAGISVGDYLRSRSYALPAFGFSVDELVEGGVFRLREVTV